MTKPKPSLRRRLIRLALLPFIAYFLYGCGLMAFQDRLIFPRHMVSPTSATAAIPARWEQITVTADDGSTIPAWLRLPLVRSKTARVPVVMFFHGNAESIDNVAASGAAEIYDPLGVAVLLVEFRGYGRATGTPSEKGITSDCVKFYDLLAARPEIDPARIVFYGRSLGGGVACSLARERKPAALIMQSCFTSINAMAAQMWVPGFLVRHKFRNDEVIPTLDCPILFMHGSGDQIIPCAHTDRLAALAKHGRVTYQSCDHNDFPADFEAYERDIEQFLKDNRIIR